MRFMHRRLAMNIACSVVAAATTVTLGLKGEDELYCLLMGFIAGLLFFALIALLLEAMPQRRSKERSVLPE